MPAFNVNVHLSGYDGLTDSFYVVFFVRNTLFPLTVVFTLCSFAQLTNHLGIFWLGRDLVYKVYQAAVVLVPNGDDVVSLM